MRATLSRPSVCDVGIDVDVSIFSKLSLYMSIV